MRQSTTIDRLRRMAVVITGAVVAALVIWRLRTSEPPRVRLPPTHVLDDGVRPDRIVPPG